MKKTMLKKLLAIALAMLMIFSLTACDGDSATITNDNDFVDYENNYPSNEVSDSNTIEDEDLLYVMVYNPKIYDESNPIDSSVLETGYLGNQIEVEAFRGDGLEDPENPYISFSQKELEMDLPWDKINIEGNRGEVLNYDYQKGSTRGFYTFDKTMQTRQYTSMTCEYAGKYCYIWSDGSVFGAQFDKYGKEFDENIYEQVTKTFGTARFVGETGKVNIFFYPMMDNLCGCFSMLDLFSKPEVSAIEIGQYGLNTDHAIIHLNSQLIEYGADTVAYSTLAHEFQHLICGTNFFSTVNNNMCKTWLNESMSGYIEEKLYNGSKAKNGHYTEYNKSARIRKGQSMYNFATDMSGLNFDIGVYGSVYYFAEYLNAISGDDVFSKVHSYWRNSYSSTLSEAEALINSVSSSAKSRIDSVIEYPSTLIFNNSNDEWMSKLILDFYLTTLSQNSGITAFNNINKNALVYDELLGAKIEGGGRILLRVKNNKFEVPLDADNGLIYIGLDKNFSPVTGFIYK